MKYRLFYLFFLFLLQRGYCQNEFTFLTNSTIKFEVGKTLMKFIGNNKAIPGKYLIHVQVDSTYKKEFMKLGKNKLLELLTDPQTDWATNLLLYDIFKKDAFLWWETGIKDWKLVIKDEDILYWNSTLK
ncbi:hypothetical protein QNI19_12290 [Cytophagaceae bacterium DM2B3-1]|uniref:Uncharacterized protein n=1 Tax=Xanthocytophaga flava TaxID=3048013 RepID=A0ABT7CJ04_9BACT|nr:hypothetical protein [Xanthocytophaga flavus]MDJ1493713.1 hypothetical protein [Xanthocytophaga flavus]